jgi:hypothetical protein
MSYLGLRRHLKKWGGNCPLLHRRVAVLLCSCGHPLGDEDTNDLGYGNSDQRAENAVEYPTGQNGAEDRQWVQLHAAAVDCCFVLFGCGGCDFTVFPFLHRLNLSRQRQ